MQLDHTPDADVGGTHGPLGMVTRLREFVAENVQPIGVLDRVRAGARGLDALAADPAFHQQPDLREFVSVSVSIAVRECFGV